MIVIIVVALLAWLFVRNLVLKRLRRRIYGYIIIGFAGFRCSSSAAWITPSKRCWPATSATASW